MRSFPRCPAVALLLAAFAPSPARAGAGLVDSDLLALHAQSTFVWQGHDGFHAPYSGPQSLPPAARGAETWDLTFYGGLHPWRGGEIWLDGEVDQGFGIGNTLGIAGFTSGEAYKLGRAAPYLRLQRAFIRQTIDLGGASDDADADLNQFALPRTSDRLVLTVGKFSITDLFDGNDDAHDPRADFLNWSVIDTATFDYAADSWGYSSGAAAELYTGRWTLRSGAFLTSNVPNSPDLDTSLRQFQADAELEERHHLAGRPGKVVVTAFLTHARMARFDDATRRAAGSGEPPTLAPVRRPAERPGIGVSLQQDISRDLGAFLRAGWADGRHESYEFTDVDRTLAAGLSLGGAGWRRPDDRIGLAGAVDVASRQRRAYLAAGGLGLLIGDGRLPHPGDEHIVELYYDAALRAFAHVTLDYQCVGHPAYNRDRGPVSVAAIRLHVQF